MAQDMLPKNQDFSCPTAYGIVPPGKKKCVSVFFHPKTLDVRTMGYVTVMLSGCASQTLVKVVGFCRGTGNPRTLHFSGDRSRSSPCLGLGNAACLLRAGCLLALQPLCCCPLVDSVRNQLRTPGDHVPALTPGDLEVFSGCWAPSLSSLAAFLQAAPPPVSGALSETPLGRLIVQPHPGGRAHSQGPHLLCPGPDVSLQHYCVNFSWIHLGERSEQSLWIENKSDCTAHFQFAIDCQESVFSVRPTFGTLVGKARMTLLCAFQPTHPIIYFRRVACLIHHQVSGEGGASLGAGGANLRPHHKDNACCSPLLSQTSEAVCLDHLLQSPSLALEPQCGRRHLK